MSLPFRDHMIGATRLVRAGRLGEATSLIQKALRGAISRPDDAPHAARPALRLHGPAAAAPHDGGLFDGMAVDIGDALAGLGKLNPFGWSEADATRSADAPVTEEPGRFLAASFTNDAGMRPYRLYVPSSYARTAALPLVVMLHGCTQSPDDFAAGTRMNALAERDGILVCYPAQLAAANGHRCWNWFKDSDQRRGEGEPSIIAGITREVMAHYAIDRRRVYVAGLSAGGALAATMAQTYPDLYAAVGVHSGLACGAAHDVPSAFVAMRQGGGAVPVDRAAAMVPTIVFHGDRDATVNPVNADAVVAQTLAGTAVRTAVEHGEVEGGHGWCRTRYIGPDGTAMVELWAIRGAGHAWSGGDVAGSYTDPQGPDASAAMLRFFAEHAGPATGRA